jgi:hypothetical protein
MRPASLFIGVAVCSFAGVVVAAGQSRSGEIAARDPASGTITIREDRGVGRANEMRRDSSNIRQGDCIGFAVDTFNASALLQFNSGTNTVSANIRVRCEER